jgi:hypothetical protein
VLTSLTGIPCAAPGGAAMSAAGDQGNGLWPDAGTSAGGGARAGGGIGASTPAGAAAVGTGDAQTGPGTASGAPGTGNKGTTSSSSSGPGSATGPTGTSNAGHPGGAAAVRAAAVRGAIQVTVRPGRGRRRGPDARPRHGSSPSRHGRAGPGSSLAAAGDRASSAATAPVVMTARGTTAARVSGPVHRPLSGPADWPGVPAAAAVATAPASASGHAAGFVPGSAHAVGRAPAGGHSSQQPPAGRHHAGGSSGRAGRTSGAGLTGLHDFTADAATNGASGRHRTLALPPPMTPQPVQSAPVPIAAVAGTMAACIGLAAAAAARRRSRSAGRHCQG